jgi:uncharacterized protein YkwD
VAGFPIGPSSVCAGKIKTLIQTRASYFKKMNLLDALIVLLILASAWFGWMRGFILGLGDLIRWVASLLAAFMAYQWVSKNVVGRLSIPAPWCVPLAFLLCVFLAGGIIQLCFSLIVRRLPNRISQGIVNKALGIIPGLLNGLILASIVAPLLLAIPISSFVHNQSRNSMLADKLAIISSKLDSLFSPVFDDAIRQTLNLITVPSEPESSESLKLPFEVQDPEPRPDLETQMLQMVNQERVAAGLRPLQNDPELTQVAREHSMDMFSRGYFSHYTPEGASPFDRMHRAGITFTLAGENLALAPTLSIAHHGLMNSPGHRANILRPQFGRGGIGILDGGIRGLMVSQEFRN